MNKKKQISELDTKDIKGISRRDFVTKSSLIGAGLAIGPFWLNACSDKPKENNNQSGQGLTNESKDMRTRK
jgi:hypothetical protein